MIMRTPAEDVEVSGGTIPAGKTVTCLIGAVNRDDRYFANSDTFNIFRDDLNIKHAFSGAANHNAFTMGRHFCVGAMFAKAEINAAMKYLLDVTSDIQLAEGAPPEVGIFTRAPKSLKITFTPA